MTAASPTAFADPNYAFPAPRSARGASGRKSANHSPNSDYAASTPSGFGLNSTFKSSSRNGSPRESTPLSETESLKGHRPLRPVQVVTKNRTVLIAFAVLVGFALVWMALMPGIDISVEKDTPGIHAEKLTLTIETPATPTTEPAATTPPTTPQHSAPIIPPPPEAEKQPEQPPQPITPPTPAKVEEPVKEEVAPAKTGRTGENDRTNKD